MRFDWSNILTAILLALIIAMGVLIRGASLMINGISALLDLDPFHSIRAVGAVVLTGYMPAFDPLSQAPQGTFNTFTTSRGYYEFIANIAILSGTTPSQSLAISPVIFFALEILSVFAIIYVLSKSKIAALFGSLFLTGLTGWAAISILGGDPVAENIGAVLFLIAILAIVTMQTTDSYILVGILAFLDGITIQIHPVTFYYLNVVLAASIFVYLLQKNWRNASRLVLSIVLSAYSVGLLALAGASLGESQQFSEAAYWLARLSPNIYTIDNGVLLSELGSSMIILAGISVIVILASKIKTEYILVAWAAILYAVVYVGQFAISSPYAYLVKYIPFYGPIVLSHRIMPYLPPVVCILAGIAIGQFIVPQAHLLLKPFGVRSKRILGLIVILLILLEFAPQISGAYSYSVGYAQGNDGAPAFSDMYSWIDAHTSKNSVFIVNDLGFGEYIKALASRPIVFTNSEEDLTSPDLISRATLQTCVFLPLCSSQSTLTLLRQYHVNYAVILRSAFMVDQNSSSYVRFDPSSQNIMTYLGWFESRPYFNQVYNDSNGFIFSVVD
jgi:hypothetical protein